MRETTRMLPPLPSVQPLLYAAFVLIAGFLYAAAAWGVAGSPLNPEGEEGRLQDLGYMAPWEAVMGDLPQTAGHPDPAAAEWRPLSELQQSAEGSAYKGIFWVRILLPQQEGEARDPYLWVSRQSRYDVYVDGAHVGGLNPADQDRYYHGGYSWRWYVMPSDGESHSLMLRIDPAKPGMFLGSYTLGEFRSILLEMLRQDSFSLFYALLFLILAFSAAMFYIRSHRDPSYLSFTLLTLSAGAAYGMRSQTLQLLPDVEIMAYLADLPGLGATGAFMLFLYHFAGDSKQRYLKLQAYLLFAFLVVCLAVSLTTDSQTYHRLYNLGLLPQLAFVTLTTLLFIIRGFRRRIDAETGWMLTGLLSAVLFTGLHVWGSVASLPGLFGSEASTVEYILQNAAGLGVLLFVLSLGMALVTRVARIRVEHARFTHSLEQMVTERTAELEQTNRLLHDSIRERSEAMAELSIVEERNRIAGDIHDVVGHTLTTTLVQIEAARRLLMKQDNRGMEKLEMSQELVRRSLQDIRESVHMMQGGNQDYDLEKAFLGLQARTESAAGVEIAGQMEASLPSLSSFQKKVLLHTLQEGITNGIRHGGAARFRYELGFKDGLVVFTLWNDGRAPGDLSFGFGLRTMHERVEQLGGSLEVTAPGEGGYRLAIRFPVQ